MQRDKVVACHGACDLRDGKESLAYETHEELAWFDEQASSTFNDVTPTTHTHTHPRTTAHETLVYPVLHFVRIHG
jgi:hypothetical protein